MTKFKEHIRRRVENIPTRLWAMIAALACLSCILYSMYAILNIVIVSDTDGNRRMLVTPIKDTQQLMQMSGIVANDKDNVFYTAYNGNLVSLNIERAFPIAIQADDGSFTAELVSGTVEEAIVSCGIELGEHDYTEPSLSTPVSENMAPIVVHRVKYEDTVVQEEIPFETEYKLTSLFVRNKKRTVTIQEGSVGTREITSRMRVVDGKTESTKVVDITDTVQPVNAVIKKYGAGAPVSDMEAPSGITIENGKPSSYSAVYTGRATAYSAARGRGASGLGLSEGTVAVDPNIIPYGSIVYITSTDGKFVYGFAKATDTGSALQSGHALVDLFYESHDEALMSAVKTVNMYVVR
ncbi:MAG: 3D domain-containing protein [Oscillospiraceae bacterium]